MKKKIMRMFVPTIYKTNVKWATILTLAIFAIGNLHNRAMAEPGDLDLSFGTVGKQLLTCGDSATNPSVKVLSDNSILIAATIWVGRERRICVIKLTPGGSLDSSFGSGTGKVIEYFTDEAGDPLDVIWVSGLTVLPSGNIVISGDGRLRGTTLGRRAGLVGMTGQGQLDTGFGGSGGPGKVVIPLRAYGNIIDSDKYGNIYLAYRDWVDSRPIVNVMKFNRKGEFHSESDSSGHIWYSSAFVPTGYWFEGGDMKLQADGKIVIGGRLNGKNTLIRLNPNGVPDYAFGSFGISRHGWAAPDFGFVSVAFQTNEIIAYTGGSIYRLSSAGGLISRIPTLVRAYTSGQKGMIAVQSDHKIFEVETVWYEFAVRRFQSDLTSFDVTWNGGLFVRTSFEVNVVRSDAAVDSLDRIVVVGAREFSGQIAIARYVP